MTKNHRRMKLALIALLGLLSLSVPAQMPGMAGEPVEHPITRHPFYQERSFHVLIGIVIVLAGFAAYRVVRLRWHRKPNPHGFVSEAVFVVDLVGSTHLAAHYGDGLAMRARNSMNDRVLAAAQRYEPEYALNTGDGYLMSFSSVKRAVDTAIALLRDLRDRPPDLSPGPPLAVRVGISYGEVLLDGKGVRHGAAINKAFRIEGLSKENLVHVGEGEKLKQIPERNRIFLDENAAQEFWDSRSADHFVAFCKLKGFSGLHRVYQVPWEKEANPSGIENCDEHAQGSA
jgi:class 3 adenylate cyclase